MVIVSVFLIAVDVTLISGGYCGGVPPLPIPNREVKPACADGTAMQCGRVGGRLFYIQRSPCLHDAGGDFFRMYARIRDFSKIYLRLSLVEPSSPPRLRRAMGMNGKLLEFRNRIEPQILNPLLKTVFSERSE